MLKPVLGAVIGARLLDKSPKVDAGTAAASGAIAGLVVPMILSRMRVTTLLAVAAGAYLMNQASKNDALGKPQGLLTQTKDDLL